MASTILSDLTLGSVTDVVIVLGKRLVSSQLTAEGISRLNELAAQLPRLQHNKMAIMFCGGKLAEQHISEAAAMFQYLDSHYPDSLRWAKAEQLLIEDQSTTSVENLLNAADKLIASQLCQKGERVRVRLASCDYHIERILEIEALMPEQGLIGQFKRRASKVGLAIDMSLEPEQHIAATYPHLCERGKAFLLIDQLTTYRVYLEGVKGQVFERPLVEVRREPYQRAIQALQDLMVLDIGGQYQHELERIRTIIELTPATTPVRDVVPLLEELNQILRWLNRQIDPESQHV